MTRGIAARMDQRLADLLQLFELERLEVNLFRGESRDIGSPQVFGGQVLGQALMAASATIDAPRGAFAARLFPAPRRLQPADRLPGRPQPRRHELLHPARGRDPERRADLPLLGVVPDAGGGPGAPGADARGAAAGIAAGPHRGPGRVPRALPAEQSAFLVRERPFEFRVGRADRGGRAAARVQHVWFRRGPLPDDDRLHRSLLAYVSDYHLLATATLPHGLAFRDGRPDVASIDHAMWFHRPFRVDDWLLYAMDSPSVPGARGLARGSVFDRDGRLVASTAQEGLMRTRGG